MAEQSRPQVYLPPKPAAVPTPPSPAIPPPPAELPAQVADIITNERTYSFSSAEEMKAFVRLAHERGFGIVGTLPRLHAVRVRTSTGSDWAKLRGISGGAPNVRVSVPTLEPAPDIDTSGYSPVGDELFSLLGLESVDKNDGRGVRIAVLDTLVEPHPAVDSTVVVYDYRENTTGTSSGHGTAVASLIAGRDKLSPGLAPGAEVHNYAVLSNAGQTDAFTLARAIVQATDDGAQIVNLSLGAYSHSPLLQQAVEYALARNVAIIAATGNDGVERVAWPAAYEGVIAVGATDGNRWHAPFSNRGSQVDITAPGMGLNAAWANGGYASFSGTSAAAPLVAAATARVLAADPSLTPRQAADVVVALADEAGAPGRDDEYGAGTLNLDRLANRLDPFYDDAAIMGYWPGADGTYYALVQNRGARSLRNLLLRASVGGARDRDLSLSLQPGEVQAVPLPGLAEALESHPGGVSLRLNLNHQDARLDNNAFLTVLRLETLESQ